MKKILILLLALCPLFGTQMDAKNDKTATTAKTAKNAKKQQVLFYVNLHCQGCVDKIMKNIAFEPGVKDIVCDIKTKTVTITYDATKTDVETLQKAFEKIGKSASLTPPDPTHRF